jgi:two-component system, NtrC family, sensor kinase
MNESCPRATTCYPAASNGHRRPVIVLVDEENAGLAECRPLKMMTQLSIPKVLLLANDLASAHAVRESVRRAGMTVILDTVRTDEEFLVRLGTGEIDVLLAADAGAGRLNLAETIRHIHETRGEIPVIALRGCDAENEESERDQTKPFLTPRDGVFDSLRTSQMERLPSILRRALREKHSRDLQARAYQEAVRSADMLRENQKLIALGRLAATIAHEINNPLESLTNLLYLMEIDRASQEKSAEYLKLAQRELNRAVQICKQTLTFSRETSAPVNAQLADLMEEVLVLYGRKVADKKLLIVRHYESLDAIGVFPGEMRQVLSNLIANAIEASAEHGTLTLRIRNARKWSDRGVRGIRLTIADNGSGIPQDVLERLGEPFFTTKGQGGTGLGLWVTQSILNRYGGNLQIRSSVREGRNGSIFSIFLPTNLRTLTVVAGGGSGLAATTGSGNASQTRQVGNPDIELVHANRSRASGS